MNFKSIFYSAIVRRVAYLLVGAVVAYFGLGSAHAQSTDQGQAYYACVTRMNELVGVYGAGYSFSGCIVDVPSVPRYTGYITNLTGTKNSYGVFGWTAGNTCDKRPDWNGPYTYSAGGIPKNGSVTCNVGCRQAWFSTGDGYFAGKFSSVPGTCDNYDDGKCKNDFGSGYYWNNNMKACEPEKQKCPDGKPENSPGECGPEACPEGMTLQADGTCMNKKNECPAGNVKAPSGQCLPGDGQCAAGEAKGKDGTCKRDANGDGKPDSEEGEDDPNKDSASGGENCNAPPSCNGNPIMCLQLRTQWRIDCNTRNDRNVSGGSCGSMPICVGKDCDAVQQGQLIQLWKVACSMEKLVNKEAPEGNDGAQPEWTKVGGMNQNPALGALPGDAPVLNVSKLTTDNLDQSGFGGGGGSCIGMAVSGGGAMSSAFISSLASPPAFWCNFITYLKAVFILIGSVASVFIIARGV